jgi:hypothetical protein
VEYPITHSVPARPAVCARKMFSWKGSESSREYTSRENRFRSRPTGVVSKKDVGAATTGGLGWVGGWGGGALKHAGREISTGEGATVNTDTRGGEERPHQDESIQYKFDWGSSRQRGYRRGQYSAEHTDTKSQAGNVARKNPRELRAALLARTLQCGHRNYHKHITSRCAYVSGAHT